MLLSEIKKQHDFKFCASYQLASQIRDAIINGYFDSPCKIASDFNEQVLKPQKKSLLHDYISHGINDYFNFYLTDCARDEGCGDEIIEWCNEYQINVKDPNVYFKENGIDYEEDCPELNKYHTEYLLDIAVNKLTPLIQIEVFTLLFSDRIFLIEFNKIIAEYISKLKLSDFPDILKRDGVVKRCTYWPSWLERALFCREKGLCAICKTDLSSFLHTKGKLAIDHMVPLNLGGINDPSNFQMLCEKCNTEKQGNKIITNNLYLTFW